MIRFSAALACVALSTFAFAEDTAPKVNSLHDPVLTIMQNGGSEEFEQVMDAELYQLFEPALIDALCKRIQSFGPVVKTTLLKFEQDPDNGMAYSKALVKFQKFERDVTFELEMQNNRLTLFRVLANDLLTGVDVMPVTSRQEVNAEAIVEQFMTGDADAFFESVGPALQKVIDKEKWSKVSDEVANRAGVVTLADATVTKETVGQLGKIVVVIEVESPTVTGQFTITYQAEGMRYSPSDLVYKLDWKPAPAKKLDVATI